MLECGTFAKRLGVIGLAIGVGLGAGGAQAAGVIALPQTGQTACYSDTGSTISCAGTGQDGDVQAGVGWPSPRFVFSGDCFTDQLTGLMWVTNALTLPSGTWAGVVEYSNSLSMCGFSDWREANANEIASISNSAVECTSIWMQTQGISFPPVNGFSSTTLASSTTSAFDTQFCEVPLITLGKTSSLGALPVRGGQANAPDAGFPANIPKTGQTTSYATGDDGDLEWGVAWPTPRFTNNGDGTITDELTGLGWTQDASTPGPPACSPGARKGWQAALDHVQCLNANSYLGYADWRLPNKFEMRSIVDYGQFNPALPAGHPFVNVNSAAYWTSTTILSYNNRGAWSVNLYDGQQPFTGVAKDIHTLWAWPVRDAGGGGGLTEIGPVTVPDVFQTPPCWFESAGCSSGDFPVDWGVLRTFTYAFPPGGTLTDVLIDGTWGGSLFGGTAPVEVYLEGFLVAECLVGQPCWDNASTVDWNGGAGFLLSDLGVDFSSPGVRALFEDGDAELSVVQNDEISANMSDLEVTLYLPEPDGLVSLVAGMLGVALLAAHRIRKAERRRGG